MSDSLHALIGGPRHREYFEVPDRSPHIRVPDPPDPSDDIFAPLTISEYRLTRLAEPDSSREVQFYAHSSLSSKAAAALAWEYLVDRNHALAEIEVWARLRGSEVTAMLDAAMAALAET